MKPPPPNALVNKFVVLLLALLMFSGTLGLGAVWVRQEIFATANRNRLLQGRLADASRKLDEVRAQVATAESVAVLLERNDAMRLALTSPRELQVVRVNQDPTLELSRKRAAEAIFGNTEAAATGNLFAFRVTPASLRR